MRPIREVLNRIRWDPSYAGGQFSLAYIDHRRKEPVVVPFALVTFDAGTPSMIGVVDRDGESRKIPLHRIQRVYQGGDVLWERPPRARPEAREP
ncbi:MAG: DUF504 domain-containing protein [Vicinamibacterales bacterium]